MKQTLISVVIFSRDRAMQLDACIRTFAACAYARPTSDHEILFKKSVLYAVSNEQHFHQYVQLQREHSSWNFVHESVDTSFRKNLLKIVGGSDCVMFVVDDTIFVKPFNLEPPVSHMLADDNVCGVSLRLGRNTDYCYPLDRPQAIPEFKSQNMRGYWSYEFRDSEGDFSYPVEVSSSVYRTRHLSVPLRALHYTQPNELESAISRVTNGRTDMICYDQSVATSVPANRVQSIAPNRKMDTGRTAADLANDFDWGYRIDIDEFAGKLPNACHCEWDLTLMKKS
jgi:hypothetical protein